MTAPEPSTVAREVRDAVAVLTLDRPERRNALSRALRTDLTAALAWAESDAAVRAVVLTGAGKAFCAGLDLAELEGTLAYDEAKHRRDSEELAELYLRLLTLAKPVIAAVNGPAVGAGCDLALMCDIRIASNTAFFAESFVKLGLIPGDGGAWLLPRAIGPARAAEMALTGDRVDAATALKWGIVSRVVEPADLLPTAREIASRIAANPPVAVRMTKKLLRESSQQTLDQLLELSATMQAVAHHTEDHREAVAAFLEKRPGRFTGA